MNFTNEGNDAGWNWFPVQDKPAISNKKETSSSALGSKLIYNDFECGNCTYKVNVLYTYEPDD